MSTKKNQAIAIQALSELGKLVHALDKHLAGAISLILLIVAVTACIYVLKH